MKTTETVTTHMTSKQGFNFILPGRPEGGARFPDLGEEQCVWEEEVVSGEPHVHGNPRGTGKNSTLV